MPRDYDDDDDDRPRRRRSRDDDDDDERPRSRRSRRDDDDDDDDDRRPAKKGGGKTLAIVLGIVGGVVLLGGVAIVFLVMFIMGKAKEAVARAEENRERIAVQNNYKAVGIAAHNYHDQMMYLPSPQVRKLGEPNGGPPPTDLDTRLGWRVEVLPFIEQGALYRQFDTSGPWNSPANQPHSGKVIREYADYDTPADPTTRVRCFYDGGALFDTRGRVTLVGITDGTSNTIMYVEGGDKVTWTRFQEYKYDPKGPLPTLGRADRSTFWVAMADGSTKQVKKSVSEQTLRAAITRAGGELGWLDE